MNRSGEPVSGHETHSTREASRRRRARVSRGARAEMEALGSRRSLCTRAESSCVARARDRDRERGDRAICERSVAAAASEVKTTRLSALDARHSPILLQHCGGGRAGRLLIGTPPEIRFVSDRVELRAVTDQCPQIRDIRKRICSEISQSFCTRFHAFVVDFAADTLWQSVESRALRILVDRAAQRQRKPDGKQSGV